MSNDGVKEVPLKFKGHEIGTAKVLQVHDGGVWLASITVHPQMAEQFGLHLDAGGHLSLAQDPVRERCTCPNRNHPDYSVKSPCRIHGWK